MSNSTVSASVTSSPAVSRASTPPVPSTVFTTTYTNKASVSRNFRPDLCPNGQRMNVATARMESHNEWRSAQDDECHFVSAKNEACVLKMLVTEANRYQTACGSTVLQTALSARTQSFKVDRVQAGVSSRVLSELLKDLDIVMGMCQSDAKCRSPYTSTKKSLSTLPLWRTA